MAQKGGRPLNLGIFHMRLPVSGWVSIFHRVTGVGLVLALPVVLYLLQESLAGADRFDALAIWLVSPLGRVAAFVLAWLFIQHFLSGVRHLLLDLDIGIGRGASRASAAIVFLLAAVFTLLLAFAWR